MKNNSDFNQSTIHEFDKKFHTTNFVKAVKSQNYSGALQIIEEQDVDASIVMQTLTTPLFLIFIDLSDHIIQKLIVTSLDKSLNTVEIDRYSLNILISNLSSNKVEINDTIIDIIGKMSKNGEVFFESQETKFHSTIFSDLIGDNWKLLKKLIEKGVVTEKQIKEKCQENLAIFAAKYNNLELMELCKKLELPCNVPDQDGVTPLNIILNMFPFATNASYKNSEDRDQCKSLVEMVNIISPDGFELFQTINYYDPNDFSSDLDWTLLRALAQNNQIKADPALYNINPGATTIIEHALSSNHHDVAEAIIKNVLYVDNKQILTQAIIAGNPTIATLFLEKYYGDKSEIIKQSLSAANINQCSDKSWLPFYVTMQKSLTQDEKATYEQLVENNKTHVLHEVALASFSSLANLAPTCKSFYNIINKNTNFDNQKTVDLSLPAELQKFNIASKVQFQENIAKQLGDIFKLPHPVLKFIAALTVNGREMLKALTIELPKFSGSSSYIEYYKSLQEKDYPIGEGPIFVTDDEDELELVAPIIEFDLPVLGLPAEEA